MSTARRAPAPRAPALTFDPRYLDFFLDVWKQHDFATLSQNDLVAEATAHAEEVLIALTSMGLHEEAASSTKTKGIITLLKSLKLAKAAQLGPKNAKVATIAVTPEGRTILSEPPATGGVRLALVRRLVAQSPDLIRLLRAFDAQGPLVQPVLSRVPGAPSRGAAYSRAIEDGIEQFWSQASQRSRNGTVARSTAANGRKPTPAQVLAAAQTAASASHPAGSLRNLAALVNLATPLGLLWTDTKQISDVIATSYIGSAANTLSDGYAPNAPTWEQIGPAFVTHVVQAHHARTDSSGFATIEALRGELGRALHLAPSVVDDLLRMARDVGDKGQLSFTLQFEPNDELIHAKDRHPLIWRNRAYDFSELRSLYPQPSGVRGVRSEAPAAHQ